MMKKSILIFGLLLIFILSFNVIAADAPVALDQQAPTTGTNTNGQLIDQIGNADLSGVDNIGTKTNSFFEKGFSIPDYLEVPAKILFGINSNETIALNVFIVMIALWVGLLLILHNLMEIIPLFGTGAMSWAGAIIVNLLIAVSGGIKRSAEFFFGIGNTIGFMKEYGALTLILAVILIFAIWFAISKFINIMKGKEDIEIARQAGFKAGIGI